MQTMTTELEQLIGKVIGDLGGTANAALVIVGDRLGLYRALAEVGPASSHDLARKTGTHERYIREWLAAQAASGYVTYDPATRRFSMSREQAMLFADEDSPVYMAGGFFAAAAAVNDERRLAEAFRTGRGIAWSEHHDCLFCGTEKFFRPSYAGNLVQSWIPALTDVQARLRSGGTVADLGCGHGCSTVLMARAYPASTFVGFDSHAPSIERARAMAAGQGIPNVRFEVATAQAFTRLDEDGYDLVAIFDALHDMGDPRGVARRVREMLKPDGTWMIVEPAAGDRLEENLNPVGRVFYAMSTSVCVPSALSQDGGESLGAQAGPAALEDVVTRGGFSRFRIATRTPFNLVIEARR
ncbi:class I SAM-dependent methyltransferase [Aquisphaera insulae]|uniref:class I SAM-dependent methyltransferase n=1 Tax=Aquisphaera insulae TaxID=2712864 RepID=UPI0013E9E49F|nr:class I SAM-dependent methyltransferase [Aquisphaera insulae]